MIIWIASYPRSGNTFFCTLIYQVYGFEICDIYWLNNDTYSNSSESSTPNKIVGLGYPSFSLEEMQESSKIFFVKTHELPTDTYPAIYLIRDGRDSLVSYAHYLLDRNIIKKQNFNNILEQLITDWSYCGGWSNNVLAWINRNAKTCLLHFEDFTQSHVCHKTLLDEVFNKLEIQVNSINTLSKVPSFNELNEIDSILFRRGKIGGWRDEMSATLEDLFWDFHGHVMEYFGYSRQDDFMDFKIKLFDKSLINKNELKFNVSVDVLCQNIAFINQKSQELLTKEKRIKDQNKSEILEDLRNKFLEKEQLIQSKEQLVPTQDYLQKRILDLQKELQLKEETIQDLIVFRRFSLRYWDLYYVRPFAKRLLPQPVVGFIKDIKEQKNTLKIEPQYSPRPMQTPKFYRSHLNPQKLPSFTLVTPSYNHGQYIEQTINSVLEQNYPHLEYKIQDGLSDDGTGEILKKYANQVTKIISEEDTGQANAINLGFRDTCGEIMGWLNSDDLLLPGTLYYVGEYFAQHPHVDVVYGHRILINEQNQEIGRWVLPPHNQELLTWADYIPQETLFWRRKLWYKVGGVIDESFRFAMDWELLLRFLDAGATFVRLPRFLGVFRVYPHQKTQKWETIGEKEMNRLRSRYHGRTISQLEVDLHVKGHMYQAWWYYQLYRCNIML